MHPTEPLRATAFGAEFNTPYIDMDEWRDAPVRHRYVHGGFEGTQTRFSYYLPPADQYQGRFFQHVTPVPQSENLAQSATGEENKIGFAVASGAAFVETNGGGSAFLPTDQGDPTLGAYRANAAAATHLRHVARQMYGEHRVYGYLYGGSGGAYRTIGAAENTKGAWQGYAPYVPGSPMAIPNVFSVRMHAQRILGPDGLDRVLDALEPGGIGDPYAGLTEDQAAALREATRMGFPPCAWIGHRTMGTHAFPVLFGPLMAVDPGYFTDFWTVPGYLGADPTSSVHAARIRHHCQVTEVLTEERLAALTPDTPAGGVDESFRHAGATAAVRLSSVPANWLVGELAVRGGEADGTRCVVSRLDGDLAVLDESARTEALSGVSVGDEVELDNSNALAAQTYHHHQVPDNDQYPVFDQFRVADGSPLYPQRPMVVGPLFTRGAVGSLPTGAIDDKVIIVACLYDREAFPWQADWYRRRIADYLGDAADDNLRLWYVDRAFHGDRTEQEHPQHTVSYLGALHHALRALADWAERGVQPPASTTYEIVDGQVSVPAEAGSRRGVQPVVTLSVNGAASTEVAVGEEVDLVASAQVPPGAGLIVAVEWDVDGTGEFAEREEVEPSADVRVSRRMVAPRPGTSFPTVRVTAQREGDPTTDYARLANLARVRIVAG